MFAMHKAVQVNIVTVFQQPFVETGKANGKGLGMTAAIEILPGIRRLSVGGFMQGCDHGTQVFGLPGIVRIQIGNQLAFCRTKTYVACFRYP
ncbi:hypothetical protein D3C79_754770 [compost metagenome]